MGKGHIVTGLDIGTSTIKVLVVERKATSWEVLSYAQVPSFGLRRGAVVNPEEAAKNIQLLMTGVERDCGKKIHSVSVNIGGSHLHVIPSDGLISVSRADHIISEEDRERVLQATKATNIPMNEEILDVFVKEYIINDQGGIKQPVNLTGVRLEAKVILLCYFQQYFINLTQAAISAKLQIDDIVPSPLAAADAVLTREQKEVGSAVIDIGAATTSLAVFEEGEMVHLAVFPLGSGNITNDIAIGLKTDIAIAEEIKKQHGACLMSTTPDKKDLSKKKIEMADGAHSVSFTKKGLVDIIGPRVSEILALMQKELKAIGRDALLPGGIVLTGGGAKLPKIKELAKQQLKLPCHIGVPKGIEGLEADPMLSTVAGLVMGNSYFQDAKSGGMLDFDFMKGWGSKFRRMFRVFIP